MFIVSNQKEAFNSIQRVKKYMKCVPCHKFWLCVIYEQQRCRSACLIEMPGAIGVHYLDRLTAVFFEKRFGLILNSEF